jgi:hypothetical protein
MGELKLAALAPVFSEFGIRITRLDSTAVCRPWFHHVRHVAFYSARFPPMAVIGFLVALARSEGGLPCEFIVYGFDDDGCHIAATEPLSL